MPLLDLPKLLIDFSGSWLPDSEETAPIHDNSAHLQLVAWGITGLRDLQR